MMGAVTVVLVYLIGRVLSGWRGMPALGALALAVSPTFWSQAIMAEVYTAGAAMIAGILLVLIIWQKTKKPQALFVAGLLDWPP